MDNCIDSSLTSLSLHFGSFFLDAFPELTHTLKHSNTLHINTTTPTTWLTTSNWPPQLEPKPATAFGQQLECNNSSGNAVSTNSNNSKVNRQLSLLTSQATRSGGGSGVGSSSSVIHRRGSSGAAAGAGASGGATTSRTQRLSVSVCVCVTSRCACVVCVCLRTVCRCCFLTVLELFG